MDSYWDFNLPEIWAIFTNWIKTENSKNIAKSQKTKMGFKNSWFTHWLGQLPSKEALRHGIQGLGVCIEQIDTMLPGSLQAGNVVHFQSNIKHPPSGRGLGPKTGWDRTISLCNLTLRVWPKHPGNGSLLTVSHPVPSSVSISDYPGGCFFPHM